MKFTSLHHPTPSLALASLFAGIASVAACAPVEVPESEEAFQEVDEPAIESNDDTVVPQQSDENDELLPTYDLSEKETLVVRKNDSEDIRAMSLNIYVKEKGKGQTPDLDERVHLIREILEHYEPDIVGLQEVHTDTWSSVEKVLDDDDGGPLDYRWYLVPRGGGGTAKEAVVLMIKKSRFKTLEDNHKTIKNSERRNRGGCKSSIGVSNRTVQRVKLEDRQTGRIIDVFNTHFPTGDNCEKVGMSIITREYVRKFGDNVLLLDDFNTGYRKSGSLHDPMLSLIPHPFYLQETYRTHKGISGSGEDDRGDHGRSFITGGADDPSDRLGSKIDHVFAAPAFEISRVGIDRSLFESDGDRIPCGDSRSRIPETLNINGSRTPTSITFEPGVRRDPATSTSPHLIPTPITGRSGPISREQIATTRIVELVSDSSPEISHQLTDRRSTNPQRLHTSSVRALRCWPA